MRRTFALAVLLVTLGVATSCSAPATDRSAAPAASVTDRSAAPGSSAAGPSAAGPATSPDAGAGVASTDEPMETDSIYEGMFTPAQACEYADLTYAELDENWQEQIRTGAAAERRGDKAGVAMALAALEPLLTSTANTLADAAAKVADPAVKGALKSLAESATKSATFTTFAEFRSLEALNAPAETTLKRECPAHGYRMKNIT